MIEDTKDMIYIGSDFPDEYAHSEYTTSLKGTNAKAKANATQGLPETQLKLGKMGANIKKARLCRNVSVETLAKQAGIGIDTLASVEKGKSTVSMGAYAAVLEALGLDGDLELIALDEEEKKVFWNQNIRIRQRASKREVGADEKSRN